MGGGEPLASACGQDTGCGSSSSPPHKAPPATACRQDAGWGSSSSPPHKVPRLATAAAPVAVAAAAARPTPQQQLASTNDLQAASPSAASCLSDLVELNVGGALFTTTRATLEESQPQSMLAALVSGRHGPARRDAKVR